MLEEDASKGPGPGHDAAGPDSGGGQGALQAEPRDPYPRWAIPGALTGVAAIVATWLIADGQWEAQLLDAEPISAETTRFHFILRSSLAVGLLLCGGLALHLIRSTSRYWHRHRLMAEQALRGNLARMRAQFDAAGQVGQAGTLFAGDIDSLAREITETAARTIGCERVNVWRFNQTETQLHCIDLYEATPRRHTSGLVLHEHEFRNEFEALKTLRYIDADDALTDPRTAGYLEGYTRPLGITSMLDTAVRVSGRNLGVICFEHVGKAHHWTEDEIAFASQLADKFAFALMNSWRREAENNLRASETSLAEAQAIARLGSWQLDRKTQEITWSPETYRIFGVDPESFDPTPAAVMARVHPEDRVTMLQRYQTSLAGQGDYEREYRIGLDDGSVKTIHERGRTFFENGRARRSVGTLQDVTERRAAETALAYRDRILHAMTMGTAQMLEEDSLDKGMPAALEILGKALDVDRVLLFENTPDAAMPAVLRYCWEAPDVPVSARDTGLGKLGIDVKAVKAWTAPLEMCESVITHLHETSGALRELFEKRHNKSVLLMPVRASGKFWGIIGVDVCKEKRTWMTVEIETLATFGRFTGSLVQRDATRRSLESSEKRFRAVSETAKDAILIVDAGGRIVYWNRAAERILGYQAAEAEGRSFEKWLVPSRYRDVLAEGLTDLAGGSEVGRTLELAAKHRNGEHVPVELSVSAMNLAGEWLAVAIMRDVSERKQAEQKMVQMARTDELTGLGNRRTFVDAVRQAIARARRTQEPFAVLYLDLDHFKDVNDTLGHPIGDELLQRVSETLMDCVRETDTVARFGGDEFAVLAANVQDPTGLAVVANRLIVALKQPFEVQGNTIRTGCSVGIATYSPESSDPESLLSHADIALYRAKQEGRGSYCFFTESMDFEVRERVQLAADLREAIAQSSLHLAYQPQVDAESGRIVGLEALLRWQHPRLGFVPPDKFVATAETSGQIAALGHWVLKTACRQVRQWLDSGLIVPGFAINVSALQFKAARELELDIEAMLAESALPPSLLEIELTETGLMQNARAHHETLDRLREKGCRLAIDDFGTGYSSLDYLRRLPVDRIKIDRSFIGKITSDPGDATIVKAAINIAHDFGLTVVAEGVETAEQLELLREWGCREVQGYYFAKPMPAEEVAKLLRGGFIQPEAEELEAAS